MKRNTATQLLKHLTEEELRKLSKFLRSPYFNYSPSITTLFECLRKCHPAYEPQRIKPHLYWKKIFPEKKFSEQGYWKLNFKLRCLIERFMAVEQMEGNETEFKKQLIKSHAQRHAHSLFENETKYLVDKINAQSTQDIHSYSESLWLKHDYFFNALTDKYGGAIYSVEDAMQELDRFYLLAKLRFAAEIKNRERIFSKKTPIDLLEESMAASKKHEVENPAFLMYKNVLDLYVPEKAEAAFINGKKLLESQFSLLSKHDQNEVMLNLRNYAIRQLNKGKAEYWQKIFELYKLGLELDLIVNNGKISDAAFGNIVKIGCVTKALGWTEQFIYDYEKYLDSEVRGDAKILGLGILNLHKRNFKKTIDLISQHEFSQILHQLNARITVVKAWFYQFLINPGLYELLHSKLEADEKYFRRNKIISEQKKLSHINFVLATKKISELFYQNFDGRTIRFKMKNYLNKEKHIADKKWLFEVIEEM